MKEGEGRAMRITCVSILTLKTSLTTEMKQHATPPKAVQKMN